MNRVTILFFATLKDRAGMQKTTLDLPEDARVKDLKASLLQELPGLAVALDSALVSINREFAFDDDPVPNEAEVALFPPVSGGSTPFSRRLPQGRVEE
jgi:molybdopterin converting factor subunit 1